MTSPDEAVRIIADTVDRLGLSWQQTGRIVSVTLPGTKKLTTECALSVGEYTVEVRAFVARHPDENHAAVYRWLLEHNLKAYGVAFSVDRHGDIHLTGRIGLDAVTPDEIDRILGVVADTADRSFNTILELGFAESIRREWQWRLSRGESTANLAAFTHLAPDRPSEG
jgi:hypothetical protein